LDRAVAAGNAERVTAPAGPAARCLQSQHLQNRVKGLVSAAYFSDACRHEAALLGIAGPAEPRFLVAAFARSMATGAPDARAERGAGAFDPGSGSAGCGVPAVGLINLLRLNGIAAELALVSTRPASAPPDPAVFNKVESVLVYLPGSIAMSIPLQPISPRMWRSIGSPRGTRSACI
jgi:hypothetical protein